MVRISARFWKAHSEKFRDYAEAKLDLMQSLNLSEKEKIKFLTDSVKDYQLRKMVLHMWITNVPDFTELVRQITEIRNHREKRRYIEVSGKKDCERECFCIWRDNLFHLQKIESSIQGL